MENIEDFYSKILPVTPVTGLKLARWVRRAQITVTGQDLLAYEACNRGICHYGDVLRLQDLLLRTDRRSRVELIHHF